MKRSDMVNRLQELLEAQSNYGGSYRMKAEEILEALESAGMAPPSVIGEDFQALHAVYIDPGLHLWDEDLEKDEKVQEVKRRRAALRR